MKKSPPGQVPPRTDAARKRDDAAAPRDADLQPPATGANSGSPAARVMKQFAKTEAESGDRT